LASEDDLSRMLGFPINVKLVLKHLRQDMRDDWYFDTLRYKDLIENVPLCCEVIAKSISAGHGIYASGSPTVRGIPKTGFTERYALETDFFDRFIYQAAVTYLIPFIDPQLSNRVLSYRYEKYPQKTKYLFKNKIERWSTFEGISYTFKGSKKYLAVTDLANFFDHISSAQVCSKILSLIPKLSCNGNEKVFIRSAVECLKTNLEVWSFRSGNGLPQNRDASSFLANVMLHDVDSAMTDAGLDYYRYVDDMRIICESEAQARTALTTLVRELRRFGFSLNGAKTKILSHEDPNEKIAEVFTSLDTNISAINNMWKSRSPRVVARSTKYLSDLVASSIAQNQTQSRLFRFSVNRLSQLVQAGLVDFDAKLVTELRNALINSMYDNAVSTDQYCRILVAIDPEGETCGRIADYLTDRSKSIYDWQNYNLWLFLARHVHSNQVLLSEAENCLQNRPRTGESAAIFIWAMATDNKQLISNSLKPYLEMLDNDQIENWPFLNQRYLLITANTLSETEINTLRNKPSIKLARTVSRAKQIIPENNIAIIDPEPPQLSLMIEDSNDYT